MPLRRVAEPFIAAVERCSTELDLRSLMADVAGELGFAHFALVHGPSFTSRDPRLVKIDNYPAYWSERFTEDRLFLDDPILHAGQRAGRIFGWDELASFIRVRPRQLDILEAAAAQGIGMGYTMPVQILGEPAGSCSLAMRRGVRLPMLSGLCASIVGQYAFEAARRISGLFTAPGDHVHLSRRERDCLRHLCDGLTNMQIARELGLSPETVKLYIKSAMAELQVHSRAALIAKALGEGHVAYQPG